jgi:hypothetical protein
VNEFEQYLIRYGIDPFHVFRMAGVRYLTVHNAIKGNPILPENAEKIKDALFTSLIWISSPQHPGSHLI